MSEHGHERDWPVAALDRIGRLHVLAEAIPSVSIAEAVLDAPFERVWGWVSDIETSTPRFDGMVRRLRIRHRDGNRLRIMAWQGPGALVPLPFDVVLEDGWCLMRAAGRLYVVGMAAEPFGERTRFALMEGVPRRGGGLLRGVTGRHVLGDVRRLARILGVGATPTWSARPADDPARRRKDGG